MYQVKNLDYPRLETYLCYECGFHTNTTLMEQRSLYQAYQKLFFNLKDKKVMKLKNYEISTEKLQQDNINRSADKDTEPYV